MRRLLAFLDPWLRRPALVVKPHDGTIREREIRHDEADARVLVQMDAAVDLRPTEASSAARRAREDLQVARDALVKDRTAALNRQKPLRHRLLKQQHKRRLAQIERHLAAIDTEIEKRLAEDAALSRRTEILTSIPGVSRITAAGLLTQMPELGRLDFSICRPWRRSVTTRTCARSTVSSSRRERCGRSRWSPSCASSSCWATHYSNRTAAGSPNGPGGTARRSSRHDRCLRGGRAWLREGR